jgi:hypothetical protein
MKARGRPRLAANDPSVNVHFRLPAKQYDLTQKQANEAKLPLAAWFRRCVERACQVKPDKGRS